MNWINNLKVDHKVWFKPPFSLLAKRERERGGREWEKGKGENLRENLREKDRENI